VAIRCVLDQHEFPRLDYGYNVNFKLYQEDGITQLDATAFTSITVKFYKYHNDRSTFWRDVARQVTILGQVGTIINDIAGTWDTQNIGEGHFAFTVQSRPNVTGYIQLEIQLSSTTAKRSTELVRLFISPSESSN
jgi:hypothetical protein